MYFIWGALISAGWGFLSPWLFLNGWLAFLGMISSTLAFFQGNLDHTKFLRNLFRFFSEMIFYFILLTAGFYIIYRYYEMGRTSLEIIVYWIVASLQMCSLFATVSQRIETLIEKSRE